MNRNATFSLLFLLILASVTFAEPGKILRVGEPIPNEYLVTLRRGLPAKASADQVTKLHGGVPAKLFESEPQGFLVTSTLAQAEAISRHPLVEKVEENARVRISAYQTNAPWNLDRIDQENLPLDTEYQYCSSGVGFRVYVMDTGVQATHQEFQTSAIDPTPRVAAGWDYQCLNCETDPFWICGQGSLDAGHGTAVASIVAGLTTGVAKGATIVPIRTHNCFGASDSATVRQGLDAIQNLEVQRLQMQPGTPAIVNMSWFFETTDYQASMIEDKIRLLINNPDLHLLFVTSANNQGGDADSFIPSRMSEVFVVAASTQSDQHWSNSNSGPEVDLYAPGDNIHSAHIGATDDLYRAELRSGTSFAAPMVSGVAVRLAQWYDPTGIRGWLLENAKARITNPPPNTTNKLLHMQGARRCSLVMR